MQIRNNYQMEWEIRGINGIVAERGMGVFNGDLGMIRSINPYTEVITVELRKEIRRLYVQTGGRAGARLRHNDT